MHTTTLRKVGGSVMITVPPVFLDILHLSIGEKLGLTVKDGQMIIKPKIKPKYKLEDLLAQCDPNAELTEEDRVWIDSPPVGKEII